MANPVRGEVDFIAGGKTYTMKLGHNARATAEGLLGGRQVWINFSDPETITTETIRGVLYASLMQHHPDLSLFDVGDMMDEVGDEYVAEKLQEAAEAANPKPSGGTGNPRKAKQ